MTIRKTENKKKRNLILKKTTLIMAGIIQYPAMKSSYLNKAKLPLLSFAHCILTPVTEILSGRTSRNIIRRELKMLKAQKS